MLDVIKENAVIFGIVNLLVGVILGHWLTIGRDKRKEFNEIAFQVRQSLLTQIEEIKNKKFRADYPSREQLVGFGIFVGRRSKKKYYKNVETYCSCFKHSQYLSRPGTGSGRIFTTVDDLDALSDAARQLLKYCNIK